MSAVNVSIRWTQTGLPQTAVMKCGGEVGDGEEAKDKRKKKKRGDESRCLHLLTTKLLSTMSTIYALPEKRENNLTTLPETFNVITIKYTDLGKLKLEKKGV